MFTIPEVFVDYPISVTHRVKTMILTLIVVHSFVTCSGLVMQVKGEDALGQQFGWIIRLRTKSRTQNTPYVCQFTI